MRPIVTAGAATGVLALVIYSLQYQHNATKDNLPNAGNAPASWEAFNTTSSVYGDLTISLAHAIPIGLVVAFIASILIIAWGVSGR